MNPKAAALVSLLLLCGCSGGQKPNLTPLAGESAESQWEMVLVEGGSALSFTGAMAVGLNQPHDGRLYIVTPYGQTLAKCSLSGGKAACESAPGTGALAGKTAVPMSRLAEADFAGGQPAAFASSPQPPIALRGKGWRAEPDGEWFVYQEDEAGWRLKLKRIK